MSIPLSQSLASTYAQYKSDTSLIAGWLLDTAKKAGFQPSAPPQPASGQGRLKGKARKAASVQASSGGSYKIRVAEFVPMATAIASCTPKISVAASLLKLFGRVIAARRQVSENFSHQTAAESKESTERHNYFLDVLEKTHSLLLPLRSETKRKKRKDSISAKPEEDVKFENRFNKLTVEDTLEENDNPVAEGEEEEPLPAIEPAEIFQDESEEEDEFFLAITLYIQDIQTLRDYIINMWLDFKNDQKDDRDRTGIIKMTLLTNTAIDLVRHLEGKFDMTLKRPKKYPASKFPVWTLPALLFYTYHPWMQDDPAEEVVRPSGHMIPEDAVCHHSCFTMWHVYSALKYYLHDVMNARCKHCTPEFGPQNFRPHDSVHSDSVRTVEMAAVFRYLTLVHPGLVAEDEITRGMRHMFKKREVPFWVTFGMQILLDLQDILGPEVCEKNYELLREQIKSTEEKFDSYRSSVSLVASSSEVYRFVDAVLTKSFGAVKHDVEDDGVGSQARLTYPNHKGLGEAFKKPYAFMTINPLRPGMYASFIQLNLHKAGSIMESNRIMLITTLAHIYKAGLQLYPEANRWPDMELALYRQKSEHMFFGGLPRSLDEARRKLELALGKSAVEAAPNRRNKKSKAKEAETRAGTRFFNETSVLDPIFSSRLGLDQWIDQSADNLVSQLISTIRSPKSQARLADQLNMGPKQLQDELELRQAWKVQLEDGTTERKVSAESPSSLFRQLALWLDGDMVDLFFDGLGFHSICGEIWDRIAEQMLRLNRKGADRHDQWAISTMAKDILTDAAKDEGKAGCIEFDNEDFALPLRTAWKEIQAYIQEPVSQPPDLRNKCEIVYGGEKCLHALVHAIPSSLQRFRPSPAADPGYNRPGWAKLFYDGWDFRESRVSCTLRTISKGIADWQTELHYRDFQRAADPCKTCEFCVQRSMLSVRYPEYAKKQPSIMDSSDVQPLNRLDLGSGVRTLYEDAISDCMQDVWAQCARFADEEEKIRALGIQGTCKSLLKYLKMKTASHFEVLSQLDAYDPGLAEFSSREGPAMAVYMIQEIREDMKKIDKLLDREIALAWNRSQDPAKYGREEDDWPVGFESLDKTFLDGHDQDGNPITIGPEILKRLDPDMVKKMLHSMSEMEGGMELPKISELPSLAT